MQAAQAGLDEAQYQISRMLRHVLLRWWIVNWSQCAKRNRYNCFGYYLVDMIGYWTIQDLELIVDLTNNT